MTHPMPPINPLERLQINDGLLLTADRWRRAHDYHRQRQNIHYQSLNQPGIVTGLGVASMDAPAHVPTQFRDGRWVCIQPGLAIDLMGNPIVVPEPMEFRISSEAQDKPLIVYLVVSFVDPDRLRRKTDQEVIRETFRIDEKNSPPNDTEIELCRVVLQPGVARIEKPGDVFFPSMNQIDLRFRKTAQVRSHGTVQIAQVMQGDINLDKRLFENLNDLLQAVNALHPALQGSGQLSQVDLLASEEIQDCDLLYLSHSQLNKLQDIEISVLKQYLDAGSVLLIEASGTETDLDKLESVQQQMKQALAKIDPQDAELATIRREMQSELTACEDCILQDLDKLIRPVKQLAQALGISAEDSGELVSRHPLRTQPFLFARFPVVDGQTIRLYHWNGIVLLIGNLSNAWGLDEALSHSRETIRSAQEMGINLLHFAWRQRQMMAWLHLQQNSESAHQNGSAIATLAYPTNDKLNRKSDTQTNAFASKKLNGGTSQSYPDEPKPEEKPSTNPPSLNGHLSESSPISDKRRSLNALQEWTKAGI